MALSRSDYPYMDSLGEMAELASKGHFATLAVDLARQIYGEDLPDEQLQGLLTARLDTLAAPGNKAVPSTMPKRFPRHCP
ncbi:hypothetical protein [Lentzea sp. CA-135723]|uniref:hypothetical protein n=1 Tax=Lentzea sp. CA-135723 TaxID=3239950 RepID=UPI003D909C61